MPDRPTPARPPGPGRGDSTGAGHALRRLDRAASPPPPAPAVPEPDRPGDDSREIGKRTYVIADVEPLDVDGVRTLQVGIALWTIATLALLPFYGRLKEDGTLWWLWTCLAGLGLGWYGLEYCRRRRKRRLEGLTPLR